MADFVPEDFPRRPPPVPMLAPPRDDGQLRPKFREDGMTFRDFVRDVVGLHLSNAECDAILWELTPFPLPRGRDDLMPYLMEVRDGTRTFESVYAEMDAAIAAAHPEEQA